MVKTYSPDQVLIALGAHSVTGYADDSFISIESSSDGVTKKTGCDGEIVRSISPDHSFKITLTLLQTSDTNAWLQEQYNRDQKTGDGIFPVLIKDLKGGLLFSADEAWAVKPANRGFGKEASNREWQIDTGAAVLNES